MTLEISFAPRDLRHVVHVLPHQLRQWAGQVGEILCTVDLEPTPGEVQDAYGNQVEDLLHLIDRCCSPYPHARVELADYSPATSAAISATFFGNQPVPAKTYRGGPFHAYFFGLYAAKYDYVLHLDSDMFFGGGSQSWTREAVELMQERTDVLLCGPLPGPPTPNGTLAQIARPDPHRAHAFRFSTMTTRRFLLDRKRFLAQIPVLRVRSHPPARRRVPLSVWLKEVRRMPLRDRLRPLVLSTPRNELPERLIGEAMTDAGLHRIDFLGRPPGMWSLHPREHSERFYEMLPTLVAKVENGDVPDDQRGHYDLVESTLR